MSHDPTIFEDPDYWAPEFDDSCEVCEDSCPCNHEDVDYEEDTD